MPVLSSDNAVPNTATDATASELRTYRRSKKNNVLDAYRSYTYTFTLAALKKIALVDPTSYRNNEDYYIIAKSGGKGTVGIIPPTKNSSAISAAEGSSAESTDLINSFNKNSPGRFDFYIDNVNIDTVMGFDERTNTSFATKIEFDLFEPYSMSGFIEALQVAAVAAGYDQYMNCPYLLKMEFFGYPDDEDVSDIPEKIPDSTRYFVFGFVSVDINVDQDGTRYSCKGVPFNEKGLGEPSTIKTNIKIAGNTVGELLKDLENQLNQEKISDTKDEKGNPSQTVHDIYEIIFPEVNEFGEIKSDTDNNNVFSKSTVIELLKSDAVYAMPDPGTTERNDPNKATITFQENSKVYDCIVAIIRDSSYVRDILKQVDNGKGLDQYGMVNYFVVNLEVEDLDIHDNRSNKPFYKYRYLITPYKVHYSKLPLSRTETIDTTKLKTIVNRNYDYLYTGANVNIKNFNLKFNTLFYQAIPKAMGNKKDTFAGANSAQQENTPSVNEPELTPEDIKKSLGRSVVRVTPESLNVTQGEQVNAGKPQLGDPYATLAKNLHQAILTNVDQVTIEIDIIGDPYYLVTGAIGNYRPKLLDNGITEDGEASYTTGDVLIIVTFRNPVDIDSQTGEAIFDNKITPYSGVFKVISVANKFKDGLFTQILNAVRFEGQVEETQVPPPSGNKLTIVESKDNPKLSATQVPPERPSGLRASVNNLLSSIAKGLPLTGLPGSLSTLANSVGGSLAGFAIGATSIGGIVNTVAGGAGSALQGLANVGSTVRLAASGLTALSSVGNSAGASLMQLTDTARSAGLPGASNLIGATQAVSSVAGIGNTALSAVGNLGNAAGSLASNSLGAASGLAGSALSAVSSVGSGAAGLISGVSSKIDNLGGIQNALSSQLGVDTSKLSGLSSNLQSSIGDTLKNAVSSLKPNVDIGSAVNKGLLLNNIPVDHFGNIPATQPFSLSPQPQIPLQDVKYILSQGGSLSNISNIASIPNVSSILSDAKNTFQSGVGLDASAIAGKISTVQSGLNSITGNLTNSMESSLNNISSIVPSGLPNVSGVASSVANKFGSISSMNQSPLDTLMRTV